MKKFLLLLVLLSSLLYAKGTPVLLQSYSTDENISIGNISQYASKFVMQKQEDKDLEFEIILFNSEDDTYLDWMILCLTFNYSTQINLSSLLNDGTIQPDGYFKMEFFVNGVG